jgi:hypothetical protein
VGIDVGLAVWMLCNHLFVNCLLRALGAMQGGYPTASWEERAAIAATHEWWTRAAWEFLRTDDAVPASIRAEAAQWGLAADEFLATAGWPPQLYVRESVRMRGLRVMTQADVTGGTIGTDPTSVGLSQWLVDIHSVRRIAAPPSSSFPYWDTVDAGDQNTAHKYWQLTEIPYGALIPALGDTASLLVPVCASFTHVGFATYRLEAQYMVFGQSASVAAVLALRAGSIDVQSVSVAQLQVELLAQGQLLDAQSSSAAVSAQICVPGGGSLAQQWAYVPADGTLRVSGVNGSICASIFGYSRDAGAAVWAAQCHPPVNSSNQHFDLVPASVTRSSKHFAAPATVQVRSRLSDLCIAVNGTVPATAGLLHAAGRSAAAVVLPESPSLIQVPCTNGAATMWIVQTAPSVGLWQPADGQCPPSVDSPGTRGSSVALRQAGSAPCVCATA